MAKLIPSVAPDHSPKSELRVRTAVLPVDGWVVLHSVVWQGMRRSQQADGEADFLILVPGRGILVLEVKGGGVEIRNGEWVSIDGGGNINRIKNPFEQAKDSKYALLNYLTSIDRGLGRIPVVHGVVFPDITFNDRLGLAGPREIVVDRADLSNPESSVARIFDYWRRPGDARQEKLDAVCSHLAPTTSIRRRLGDVVEEADQGLIALTRQQIALLQGLRRHRRATIIGGAGTGKTILAIDKACRLVSDGYQVLLVCYNAPLREEISRWQLGNAVVVATFHELVKQQADLAGVSLPAAPDQHWYSEVAPEVLKAAIDRLGTSFGAVIVDEGQDFPPEWIDACSKMVAEDGIFYVFADPRQDIYHRNWVPEPGCITFELTVNCRNTKPISSLVASIYGDSVENLEVDGPMPVFEPVTSENSLVRASLRRLEEILYEDQIPKERVAVLSDSRAVVNKLRESIVGEHMLCPIGGRGVVAETIHRFKGLDREVVVLVLSPHITPIGAKELLYVGLSRARAALWVFASPETAKSLGQVLEGVATDPVK